MNAVALEADERISLFFLRVLSHGRPCPSLGRLIVAAAVGFFLAAGTLAAAPPQWVKEERAARALEKAYGIRIAVVDLPPAHEGITYTPLTTTDSAPSWMFLRLFIQEFQNYPPAFVKSTGLQTVALATDLRVGGQPRSGIPDPGGKTLWFDVKAGAGNDAYQRTVIHHEFYHLIERQLNSDVRYKDPKWAILNPPEFRYGDGGETVYRIPGIGDLNHPAPGFINKYSQSGIEEDKAELFETFFVPAKRLLVMREAERDPILRAKLEYIRGFVAYHSATVKEGKELEGRKLLLAAKLDNTKAVLAALDADPSLIEYRDWLGWTALHWAVSLNRQLTLSFLLKRKLDLASADKDGWTPLHIAAFMGQIESCQALLDAGADRSVKDKLGRTPRDLAKRSAAESAAEVVALLKR